MAASSSALPSFERSISLNDLDSALNVREQVERDLVVPEDAKHRFLRATPHFSFVLPSFRQFDALDFRKFLYSSLVDVEIFKELENSKILNWCKAVHAMVPLLTLGDGNCLMHAASLAMWGVNDRYQILRRAVYQSLLEDAQGVLIFLVISLSRVFFIDSGILVGQSQNDSRKLHTHDCTTYDISFFRVNF